jgi:hypothetical protein
VGRQQPIAAGTTTGRALAVALKDAGCLWGSLTTWSNSSKLSACLYQLETCLDQVAFFHTAHGRVVTWRGLIVAPRNAGGGEGMRRDHACRADMCLLL